MGTFGLAFVGLGHHYGVCDARRVINEEEVVQG